MSEVYISQMFTNLLSFRFIHIMLKVHNHSSLLGTHHTMCFSFSTTNQIKIRLYCYIEKKKFIIFPNETSPKSPKTVLNESWSHQERILEILGCWNWSQSEMLACIMHVTLHLSISNSINLNFLQLNEVLVLGFLLLSQASFVLGFDKVSNVC